MLRQLGYELVSIEGRGTLEGVLANAKRCGLKPDLVIDVGAGRGDFAKRAAAIFPDAALLLVEPLSEFTQALNDLCATLPQARWIAAVASDQTSSMTLNVHPDLFGSSLLLEDECTNVNGTPRSVSSITLDSQIIEAHAIVLKIDVQGAELKVLAGAADVLKRAELVILETSFFHFFPQGPLFDQVVSFMLDQGFVLYDLFGLSHRPLDGALAQVDAVFAKREGTLRSLHHYATPEQRAKLTRRLRS
ncbi:MAG: FkbM family methyltransferase [Alphaproteobacteria bacterium]|nr:FkbM family methyltransferase [Alphaproteobacteria bacterium]